MEFLFCGSSIDECLKKATNKLNISKNDLKYKIIKEERKFFKNRVEIQILNNMEEECNASKEVEKDKMLGAKVEDGKIIIKNSDNTNVRIKASDGILLFLNGKECTEIENAKDNDEISYEFEQQEAKRKISVNVSENKLEAFITIESLPQPIYELVDTEYTNVLVLEKKVVDQKYLPKYTKAELMQLLNDKKIKNGIIDEAVEGICEKDSVDKVLVAIGQAPIDDIPDTLDIKFMQYNESEKLSGDEFKINYRNVNSICNVKTGDLLAKIIKGKSGRDGIDVFGNEIKRKISKPIPFKTGTGCILRNDEIISEIEGRPSVKGNLFSVHKVYNVDEVNLSSGNINFIGDVVVNGDVDEGMEVKAGGNILVNKNVESAKISSSGEISIIGNIVNSTILAGSDNVEHTKYLENINNLGNIIDNIINSVLQIKEHNLLGERQDGEIVKILMESKFKNINSVINNIINYNVVEKIENSMLIEKIKSKLIGAAPLNIKDISELNEIKAVIKNEVEGTEDVLNMQSDIYMSYIQGSTVEASGSVYIVGNGQFTSNITSLKNIEFTEEGSVCRGGILSAENEIKLKTVGSQAAVNTVLKVSKTGKISADIAYSNTTFCFGQRQLVLDVASRNVIAYLDSDGEIKIERLLL